MASKGNAIGWLIGEAKSANDQATTVAKRAKNGLKALYARVKRSGSRATFIAVTGSSGKTTTVSLLAHILSVDFKVRTQVDRNGFDNASKTLRQLTQEDQFVILELGTGAPGQLERVTRLVRPDIAIVTLVALEHFAAFRSIEAVAEEKAMLVRGLSGSGLAILNADDPNVRDMSASTNARIALFGTSKGDYQATNLRTSALGALALTLGTGNRSIALESQLIGAHSWLAISAAATCALQIGVSPQTIAARVASFQPIARRLSVHKVAGGPTFLLDTAKAPYHSVLLPLEALRTLTATRKRFVLGQISDYRGSSNSKYQEVYRAARAVADEVIFVGANAHKVRASREDIEQGRFRAFDRVEDLSAYLRETGLPEEVILLKSSRNLHLERLMLDWGDGVHCWPNECGKKVSCFECGLYRMPFVTGSQIVAP